MRASKTSTKKKAAPRVRKSKPKESGTAVEEGEQQYVLRLYVTGATPRSARAIDNIRSICEERLEGHYTLEVVDVYQQPQLAQDENIVALPTLVKQLPQPLRRMVGDLSKREKVLHSLDLSAKEI
jgi:circadian clock protein KaiB